MWKKNVLFASMSLLLLSGCGNQPPGAEPSSGALSSSGAAVNAASSNPTQTNAPAGSTQNRSGSDTRRAAKDFESSDSQLVGDWGLGGASTGGVRIEGAPSLDTSISLYWPSSDNRPHVVRFNLHATGIGQLQVQLYADGKPDVLGEQYLTGDNKLYFELPPHVAGSRVTVTRGPGSAAVSLQGVVVRALTQDGAANPGSTSN